MNQNKGITLISLVITIIVLLIITGVTTYSGIESIESTKKVAKITELEMVQSKVNSIYEERKSSQSKIEYYDAIGKSLSNVSSEKITQIFGTSSSDGFKYFDKEELKKIELEDISQEILINYDTREVISLSGITVNNIKYYKLTDIPNYSSYNVEYQGQSNQKPTFEADVSKQANSWKITLKNIQSETNGTLSYKLHSTTNWTLKGNDTSFEVYKPGLYDIKYTDKSGNSTTLQKWMYSDDELILYLDGENNSGNGHSTTTTTWKDLSGKNNDGILKNFTDQSINGWQENYLQLDGSDDGVYLDNKFSELFNQNATIEFVLYFEGNNERDIILGNYDLVNSINFERGSSAGTQYYQKARTYYDSGNYNKISTNEIYPIQKKLDITITFNKKNNTIKYYINGEFKEELTSDKLSTNCKFENVWIGRDSRSGSTAMKGNVYLVRFYNRELFNEEISENYKINEYRFNITK